MDGGAMEVGFHSEERGASDWLEEIDETEGFGLQFHGLAILLPAGYDADAIKSLKNATFLVFGIAKAGNLNGVRDAVFARLDLLFHVVELGCLAVFIQDGLDALLDISILPGFKNSMADLIDGSDERYGGDRKDGQSEQHFKKRHPTSWAPR